MKTEDKPVAAGNREAPDQLRSTFNGTRYVFTSAQNNTYVHPRFWKSLLRFCEHRGARLVVGSFTYNKNGFQNLTKDNEECLWFDPKVRPYFVNEATTVRPDLVWCGELDILPTAVNPLSGFDNYTRSASSIIPHSKVQMKSVPTMKHEPTKFLYTTGTCTLRNYIQRKAGQKAAFHHVFGALYVEVDDEGDWFARQLIADKKGTFYDLTEKFSAEKVSTGHRVVAVNWGDIHAECPDHQVAKGAWIDPDTNMLDVLAPKYQFVHDLTDFRSRNHHNLYDPFFLSTMVAEKSDSVERGLRHSAVFLMLVSRKGCQTVVVDSNHDQALERWLKDKSGHLDPVNAGYWHSLNAWVHKQIKEHRSYHVFEHAIRALGCPEAVRFLREDDSFEICRGRDGSPGIECSIHGHRGPNGSRGSPNAFRVVGKRSNTGHTHIAGILDGVFTAGVSARLDLDYNKGPSAWSHSHIVTYANSKRTIITMKGKKWRAS